MTLKEAIVRTVACNPGVNNVKLAIDVMTTTSSSNFDKEAYNSILEKMVEGEEIVELDYILPEMLYRIKSLYFPKGTTFILAKLHNVIERNV